LLSISTSTIAWTPCFRVIANRYPPINFFETLTSDPSEWEMLVEVERLTDPSFDVGAVASLEEQDRISGRGSGRILPSFTFHDPVGTRFSTRDFGAYYAANDLKTAVTETIHHRTLFMLATGEPAQDIDNLLILADLQGDLHDIRLMKSALPDVYHPSDYQHSQALAQTLRTDGSFGIVYQSVRNAGGECVAIWRARVLSNAREDRNITYRWDGAKITGYFDKSQYNATT
jgi:hypothetical protein